METNKFQILSGLNRFRILIYAFIALDMFAVLAYAQVNGTQLLSQEFCAIVNDIRDVVGVFALAMFLIGGILYAAGHFMPAAGNIRSTTQGWAMGMIIGGIIGLILVIIAPTILQIITSFGAGNGSINASC